jgi:hypothetical protein
MVSGVKINKTKISILFTIFVLVGSLAGGQGHDKVTNVFEIVSFSEEIPSQISEDSDTNLAPFISVCPPSLSWDHCLLMVFQFLAFDPEDDTPLVFQLVSGPGTIDSITGIWTYQPTIADVGSSLTLEVAAKDPNGSNTFGYPCITAINVFNYVPEFSFGCNDTFVAGKGKTTEVDFEADPVDCDSALTFTLSSVNPQPVGNYSLDAISGILSFSPADIDAGVSYEFEICFSDGPSTVCCNTILAVSCCDDVRGDANGDGSDGNILDLTYFVDFIFRGGEIFPCGDEADLNLDGADGNILDLTKLVDFIFRGGADLAECP